jgi:hypothetical protein
MVRPGLVSLNWPRALLLLVALQAAGCADRRTAATAEGDSGAAPRAVAAEESSEVKALRAMKVGDRFPLDRWIDPSRLDEDWTIAAVVRAHSRFPVSGSSSDAPCEAVAALMKGHDGELVSWAALALICEGKLVETREPAEQLWGLRTPLSAGEVHFELRFVEALEPGREILWLSSYEFGKGEHFSVQELLARANGGRLEVLMDSNCLDWLQGQGPRRLLGNYPQARAAYRARFEGPVPRAFIFESNEGRGFRGAKVSFQPGAGYEDDLSLLEEP